MKRSAWRTVVYALACALALGAATASRAETGREVAAVPDRPGAGLPDSAWLVADHLMRTYGVSEDEAWRRTRVQASIPQIVRRLESGLPDSYAGIWLDQEHGGVLQVATKGNRQAAALSALSGLVPPEHVRVVAVARSLRELDGAAQRVRGRVPDRSAFQVGVDVVRNRVSVRAPVRAVADRAELDRSLAAEGAVLEEDGPLEEKAALEVYGADECDPLACNPPMRGGLRLDLQRTDTGQWGGCTNGFNVADSRGWVYTMTAGHCLLSSPHHTAGGEVTFHNGLPVGHETGEAVGVDGAYLDYMIMPYYAPPGDTNWSGYWFNGRINRNTVAVYRSGLSAGENFACYEGTNDRPGWHCSYPSAVISGLPEITRELPPGAIVCGSGSASGRTSSTVGGATIIDQSLPAWKPRTTCGAMWNVYTDSVVAGICTAPGDSGGPLWDPTTGHGIGTVVTGPAATATLGVCSGGNYTYYTRLDVVFDDAAYRYRNSHGGATISYSLITTS